MRRLKYMIPFNAGIVAFFISLFACQPKGDFETLSVDAFAILIDSQEVQRLDVRTAKEHAEGCIHGSLNIDVLKSSFAVMADSVLCKEKPVALYCRSGQRSKRAAAILSSKGFRVYELGSGFNGWVEAEKAVEK